MAKINSTNNKTGALTIDPGASGDSFVQFDINTTGEFRIGVDDTDSDKFKISQGSALGTNDTFSIADSGEITKPLTPAFCVTLVNYYDNVTGDGTVWTALFTTEYFDQGNDFDGTSTFTAPVDGKYRLSTGFLMDDCLNATSAYMEIETSNRTYRSNILNASTCGTTYSSLYQYSKYMSVLADMDASDTAVIKVMASGTTKKVDVGYTDRGLFCGELKC